VHLFWVVIADRGRLTAPRGFPNRDEAVVYATLHMAAERVEIVEAASADAAIDTVRRGRR
jgi:hypothetical protein